MKKYILVIIFLTVALNTSAQSFGLKGGMAITNFIGDDVDDLNPTSRVGFFLGSFMTLGDGDIAWMPELIFHQKGVKYGFETMQASITFNYVDFGFNGLFYINDELALAIGPYMGYLASGTDINGSITDWDDYNRIEFGSNLGATYNINDLLNIDLRYGFAFTDFYDSTSSRNSSIQIGVGYVFAY